MWQEIVVGILLAIIFCICTYILYKQKSQPIASGTFQYRSRCNYNSLLVLRLVMLAVYIVVIVVQASDMGVQMLKYYTVWNFLLQALFYILSVRFIMAHHKAVNQPQAITTEYRVLNTIFDISVSNSLMVVIVYWTLLYSPSMPWFSYIEHAINAVALSIDFCLNPFLIKRTDAVLIALLPAIYAVFGWVSYYTWLDHVWPYNFLRMDSNAAPGWYVAIFVGHLIVFGLVLLLSKAKEKIISPERPRLSTPLSDPINIA
ncbi:hypothetical protein THRCLA_22014 [Thraustotheca clavata]|uniref:FAR-17a/AIG1-like protein n=1 Tax=Thraustotheca clavata TaxID=74557 RepID=A0A1V9ZEA0_9STRA|nr:hypothetical protein THRCLA_22014 [Thraustotheca clavata]